MTTLSRSGDPVKASDIRGADDNGTMTTAFVIGVLVWAAIGIAVYLLLMN